MSDSSSDDGKIEDILLDEPMFYILTQFLETKSGKNIATVLEELTSELKAVRQLLSSGKASSPDQQ
jgi:hypothetical protein